MTYDEMIDHLKFTIENGKSYQKVATDELSIRCYEEEFTKLREIIEALHRLKDLEK